MSNKELGERRGEKWMGGPGWRVDIAGLTDEQIEQKKRDTEGRAFRWMERGCADFFPPRRYAYAWEVHPTQPDTLKFRCTMYFKFGTRLRSRREAM